MKKITVFTILLIMSLLLAFRLFDDTHPAIHFIKALDKTQREKALLSFDDASRETWHFLPAASWQRTGISIQELNASQKKMLFELLKMSLSASGYTKMQRIMELENVLAEMEGRPNYRNPERYYIAFYGNPEKDSLWAWSFEGHHISLNFTLLNDKITMAPRFFGANPAEIPSGKRKGERTLEREEDLGFQLIQGMTLEQRQKAIFRETAFPEIVTSNASGVSPLQLVGIEMKALNNNQQTLLFNIIDEYLSAMPMALAVKRMNDLKKEDIDDIRFGWAGAIERGKPHYYRIQGKTFLIEFDNTQNNANHIHTVWRDFDGDFGSDLIKEHYENAPHHH